MKTWHCRCGNRVFFENTRCMQCGLALGYDAAGDCMQSLTGGGSCAWQGPDGVRYRYCANHEDYQVCNWLLEAEADWELCRACRLNRMIPALTEDSRRAWWKSMEVAKRRLVYSLLHLGLPVESQSENPDNGLAFAFLEDKRSNPLVAEEFVATGHADGLITVNLAEADAAHREHTRQSLGESYRTLLGHFRHESGHYYFDRLLRDSPMIEDFRRLFGDERTCYDRAIEQYYRDPPSDDWTGDFISAYARSHPLEDWAECWAHYLHIVDTLETAASFGIVSGEHVYQDVDEWMPDWDRLSSALNSLNRSMGLQDAYPFVLGAGAIRKLRFVHRVTDPN